MLVGIVRHLAGDVNDALRTSRDSDVYDVEPSRQFLRVYIFDEMMLCDANDNHSSMFHPFGPSFPDLLLNNDRWYAGRSCHFH